jgi:hypothetical protein
MIDILARLKQIQESNPNINVTDAISNVERANGTVAEKAKSPYAIGMAQAMKSTGDTPPLKKSTIKKAHDIAKSIEKNEGELDEAPMTRQHFQLFADVIRKIEDPAKRRDTAKMVAGVLSQSNPRFDHARFLVAAGAHGEDKMPEDEASKADLTRKLDHLKQKYNAQMANAYPGDPSDTEEEIEKIEKQLGITHEGKKMKKDKMNESIMIATDSPEEASMMMQLLKLAGVQPVSQDMIDPQQHSEPQADETYSNTPAPMVSDVKSATPNGTDQNREKGTYPVASGGDNPMGKKMGESEITEEELSNSLRAQYESFKKTYQEAAKSKPDYLDFDKDGNKSEPMTKALKDKEQAKK